MSQIKSSVRLSLVSFEPNNNHIYQLKSPTKNPTSYKKMSQEALDDQQQAAASSTSTTAVCSSAPNKNLKKMRLEQASYRLLADDESGIDTGIENKNAGIILSLSLTDSVTRSKPESVELAMTAGQVHQMLASLRGMASTIAGLTGE